MDAMPLGWELPAEDEIATTVLSGRMESQPFWCVGRHLCFKGLARLFAIVELNGLIEAFAQGSSRGISSWVPTERVKSTRKCAV